MRLVILIIASVLLVACAATSEADPSTQASVGAPLIPASTPEASARPATPAPSPPAAVETGATFRLECGPLELGICEASAAKLVKRMGDQYPSKRVSTIVYATLCGSFQLQFDDGTGVGADVDCILPATMSDDP